MRVVEADFADPTAGLRSGLVDVAVTRGPFDLTGISTRLIRTESVGVVLRADDPLAARGECRVGEHRRHLLFCGDQYPWIAFGVEAAEFFDRPQTWRDHGVPDIGVCLRAWGVVAFPDGHAAQLESWLGRTVRGFADFCDVRVQRLERGELRRGGN